MLAGPSWRVVGTVPIAFRSRSEEHYDERSARSACLCDGALNNSLSLPYCLKSRTPLIERDPHSKFAGQVTETRRVVLQMMDRANRARIDDQVVARARCENSSLRVS